MNFKDLTGQKFGMLLVTEFKGREPRNGGFNYYWECICDCGEKVIRPRDTLRNKRNGVINCGCYTKLKTSEVKRKHLMSETRFYKVYKSMKRRVLDHNTIGFKNYGGRGIGVSDLWFDFANFKNDMYESYLEHVAIHGEKDTTLERKNVNGDYCKENCLWTTREEQSRNTRKNQRKIKAVNLTTKEEHTDTVKSRLAERLGFKEKGKISKVLSGERRSTHGFTFEYVD